MLDTVALVGDAAKVYGDVAAQTVERDPPEEARTAHKGRGAKDHRAPSHISKMVPPTIHLGPTKLDKIKNLHLEIQVSSLTLALG